MDSLIGQRLGQYQIVDLLGEGGMATVYRARQLNIERDVALKVLKGDLVKQADFLARFQREARLIASLSHPHILKLFDYGQHENTVYLVMEMLTGGSLDALIGQPQLDLPRIERLIDQITSALDYAHSQGVIHRDLKPHNILLDNRQNAILTDFGIARLLQGEAHLTQTGATLGTPTYMSPEQWRAESIDGRTDVYALGIILYELLAGVPPFKRDTVHGLMYAHLNEPPPALDTLDSPLLNMLPRDQTHRLRNVIEKAIAKSRDDRYESPLAFMTGVRGAIHPEQAPLVTLVDTAISQPSPEATPATTSQRADTVRHAEDAERLPDTQRLERQVGQMRTVLLGMGVLALLSVIVLLLLVTQSGRGGTVVTPTPTISRVTAVNPDEYMVLVAQFEQLGRQPREVTRFVVGDLADVFEKHAAFSRIRVREYPAVINSDAVAREAAIANNAAIIIWGAVDDDSIDLQVQIGSLRAFPGIRFDEAMLRRTGDVRVSLTDPRSQSLSTQIVSLMLVLNNAEGNSSGALRALTIAELLPPSTVEIGQNSVATNVHQTTINYIRNASEALRYADAASKLDPTNPLLYIFRGITRQRLGQYTLARQDAITAQRLGPSGWAAPYYTMSSNSLLLNDFAQSVNYLNEVLKLRPDDAFMLGLRAIAHYINRDYDAAEQDAIRAMAAESSDNFSYTMALMLSIRKGDIDEARRLVKIILTKFPDPDVARRNLRAIFSDAAPTFMGSYFSAGINVLIGQFEAAIADADEALKTRPDMADLQLIKGLAYCNIGKDKEAEAAYTEASKSEPALAITYLLRADVRTRLNNPVGALADLQQAQQAAKAAGYGPNFEKLIQQGTKGEINCQNIFTAP